MNVILSLASNLRIQSNAPPSIRGSDSPLASPPASGRLHVNHEPKSIVVGMVERCVCHRCGRDHSGDVLRDLRIRFGRQHSHPAGVKAIAMLLTVGYRIVCCEISGMSR